MTLKRSKTLPVIEKKIKAIYPHIVVCGSTDNPYYCIDWYDIETKEMIRGYGSYNLAFVRMWLESDFEIVDEDILGLINRQWEEIERLQKLYELAVAERETNVKGFTESLETAKAETIKDIAGYLESEIEDSDKRISEFDTSDEERGYNKGLRVALAYVQEFAEETK